MLTTPALVTAVLCLLPLPATATPLAPEIAHAVRADGGDGPGGGTCGAGDGCDARPNLGPAAGNVSSSGGTVLSDRREPAPRPAPDAAPEPDAKPDARPDAKPDTEPNPEPRPDAEPPAPLDEPRLCPPGPTGGCAPELPPPPAPAPAAFAPPAAPKPAEPPATPPPPPPAETVDTAPIDSRSGVARPALTNSAGVTPLATRWINDRLLEIAARTQAGAEASYLRVLLPAGYAGQPQHRYPVLYLLPDQAAGFRHWTDNAHVGEVVGDTPLIVVMPDAGADRVGRLTGWVDANFRTNRAATTSATFSAEELRRIMTTFNQAR